MTSINAVASPNHNKDEQIMCGRLALFSDPASVARHFGLASDPSLEPRWNVAPRQPLSIVRRPADGDQRCATRVEWGLLPSWADPDKPGPRPINARAETAAQRPMFRDAWRHRRCLVPANGWYEWTAGADGKDPWFFALPDGGLLGLAGLWTTWSGPDGKVRESAAILTRVAHKQLTSLHDRMPVVIDPEDYASWLDPAQPPAPTLLDGELGRRVGARRVTRRVNSATNEGPDLITGADNMPT